jgi:ADP-ribosylglycohydrolase
MGKERESVMGENRYAAVWAAFAADALSLGVHWMYDPEQIQSSKGRVESFSDPGPDSFHKNRKAGEFTHYGDQMRILLASLAERGEFDAKNFGERWRREMSDYDGYMDKATKTTLANLSEGKTGADAASGSADLGGAARMAPLALRYSDDAEALAAAAREQTALTHGSEEAVGAAGFLARTVHQVLRGTDPVAALRATAEHEAFQPTRFPDWVEAGIAAAERDSVSAIGHFGRACDTVMVFPGAVQLIAKYPEDLKEALIQSAMAGGESASRGMMAGMVLGAKLGVEAIPPAWIDGLTHREEIEGYIAKLS